MKKILDACCGSRMFWFDRNNPYVIFADNREVETTLCDGRQLLVKPDVKMDFRDMPYPDNSFNKVEVADDEIVIKESDHIDQSENQPNSAYCSIWEMVKHFILIRRW